MVVLAEVVEFGSPKGWEYTIGGEPQTWWRVPITNRKDPVDLWEMTRPTVSTSA